MKRKSIPAFVLCISLLLSLFMFTGCGDNYKDYLYLTNNGIVEYEYSITYDNGQCDNFHGALTVNDKKATDEIYTYDNETKKWVLEDTFYYFLLNNGDYLVAGQNALMSIELDTSYHDSCWHCFIRSASLFKKNWQLDNFKVISISNNNKTLEIPFEVNNIYLNYCKPIEYSKEIQDLLFTGQGSGSVVMQYKNDCILSFSINNKNLIINIIDYLDETLDDIFPLEKHSYNRFYDDSFSIYYFNLANDSLLTVRPSHGQYIQTVINDWPIQAELLENDFIILEYKKDISLNIPEEILESYNAYCNENNL